MIDFLSYLLLIVGIAFLLLFFYCLTVRGSSLAIPFSLICVSAAIYIIGYSFELRADSLESIRFFLKLEYFGVPFISAFWLFFTIRFCKRKSPSIMLILIVMLFPILSLFFSVTNEFHHFLYKDITTFVHNGNLMVLLDKGPWYYVQVVYAYLIQFYSISSFYKIWKRDRFKRQTQAYYIFVGSLWPIIFSSIYFFGLSPLAIDLTPYGLSISGVFFYIALFRYRFLDLSEIVKDITFMEINEGILVLDDKQHLVEYNKAAAKIFPWLERKQIGSAMIDLPVGREILDQTADFFELTIPQKSGLRYYEFRKTQLKDRRQIVGSVFFIQDVTSQKELFLTMKDMATYDPLTKLFNRRKLFEESEKELLRSRRYGRKISVLMADVDDFKHINDSYGHQAGDEILRKTAEICKERLRATDIIGRYGGEEFMMLLPDADMQNACSIAEEIRRHIETTVIQYKDATITTTLSIGVSTALDLSSDVSLEMLIHDADVALYQAKAEGKNRVLAYHQDSNSALRC
jgi:diguanylate cyclase (GGDEF)-like protein